MVVLTLIEIRKQIDINNLMAAHGSVDIDLNK